MPRDHLSFDDYDERNLPRPEQTDFDRVVQRAISRRGFLGGAVTIGLGTFLLGTSAMRSTAQAGADRFGFENVAANTLDTITVPEGYEWKTLVRWGDPILPDAPAFDEATRGTADSQARAFGDNNDGMYIYERDGRILFAVNNEYTNQEIIWGNRPDGAPETDDDVRKGMVAHGVSVFEIRDTGDGWEVVTDSDLNRRITPETEMEITGPAAGHDLLKTEADPTGTRSLGTWNNCGSGRTPWGTYLTREENFNGYFSSSDADAERPEAFVRYGINVEDWGYGWARIDERFDWSRHPNEPNRAGYVVEIDPFDPAYVPKKRTGLGRFKHENAEVVIADDGRVVVYMGDDERGEFVYKFISSGTYEEGGDTSSLLDDGTLYAAVFHDDGTGEWIALTPESTGMSAAEIVIHTRMAGSAVGATTMDRPEWVAAHPERAEIYCALTNNRNRGVRPNAGGDEAPVNGPNPREVNNYGQIVRWRGEHAGTDFEWDLYLLAGNPVVHETIQTVTDAEGQAAISEELVNAFVYPGSDNINAGNMFNSPDCVAFDSRGTLWILTDGEYSDTGGFEGHGNNQMLAGDPETGEVRRFLVGPRECEVTGVDWSPDRRTMFVGIQHPGEDGDSTFPDSGVPRSAIVQIVRTDGQPIG